MAWSSRPRLFVAVAAICVLLVSGVLVAAEAVDFDDHDSGRGEGRSLLGYSYGSQPKSPPYSKKRHPPPARRPQTCTYDRSICKQWWQPGPTCCAGKCVNLKTNVYNCGRCGKVCPWGLSCCNGNCVDLQNDPKNCGRCGTKCHVKKFGKKFGLLRKCQFGLCAYGY